MGFDLTVVGETELTRLEPLTQTVGCRAEKDPEFSTSRGGNTT